MVLRHAPYDRGADAALFDQRVVVPLKMMDSAAATIGPVVFPPAGSAALKQLDGAMDGIVFIRGSALRRLAHRRADPGDDCPRHVQAEDDP